MDAKMQQVLDFWFVESDSKDWFKKSDAFDKKVRDRFEKTFEQVVAGETDHWRDSPDGRLAEIIVLDQFTRNMFRDTAKAFAFDSLALALAQEAIRSGDDKKIEESRRAFLYMPFMHSESQKVHETAMELFRGSGNFSFEEKHKAIIDEFGRYPYRNEILGRESTPEELEWMKSNSGF